MPRSDSRSSVAPRRRFVADYDVRPPAADLTQMTDARLLQPGRGYKSRNCVVRSAALACLLTNDEVPDANLAIKFGYCYCARQCSWGAAVGQAARQQAWKTVQHVQFKVAIEPEALVLRRELLEDQSVITHVTLTPASGEPVFYPDLPGWPSLPRLARLVGWASLSQPSQQQPPGDNPNDPQSRFANPPAFPLDDKKREVYRMLQCGQHALWLDRTRLVVRALVLAAPAIDASRWRAAQLQGRVHGGSQRAVDQSVAQSHDLLTVTATHVVFEYKPVSANVRVTRRLFTFEPPPWLPGLPRRP